MAERYFDVANQETSEEILSKIGNTNDEGEHETLAEKLNKIFDYVTSTLTEGELVSIVADRTTRDYYTTASTGDFVQVLSIDGSGVITDIAFRLEPKTTSAIKIYIDGKLYLHFRKKHSGKTGTETQNLYFGGTLYPHSLLNDEYEHLYYRTYPLSRMGGFGPTIDIHQFEIIIFRKSLSIEISSDSSANKITIGYGLKE